MGQIKPQGSVEQDMGLRNVVDLHGPAKKRLRNGEECGQVRDWCFQASPENLLVQLFHL